MTTDTHCTPPKSTPSPDVPTPARRPSDYSTQLAANMALDAVERTAENMLRSLSDGRVLAGDAASRALEKLIAIELELGSLDEKLDRLADMLLAGKSRPLAELVGREGE